MTRRPRVSIIVPAYRSAATLASSLHSFLGQDYPEFQLVVVDSTADDSCRRIVAELPPSVVYRQSEMRLLPHAARNLGVALADGDLLLFTDPDIYAPTSWLRRMVDTQQAVGGAVVSPLECHAPTWLTLGIHHAKFDQLLPGGGVRPVGVAATAGLLCRREDYERVNGFAGEWMLGDTLFGWRLLAAGIPLHLNDAPAAEHHHTTPLTAFMSERFTRGREFANLHASRHGWGPLRRGLQLAVTVLPLRLVKWLLRSGIRACRAGRLGEFVRVAPIVLLGHACWLAGEVTGSLVGDGGRGPCASCF